MLIPQDIASLPKTVRQPTAAAWAAASTAAFDHRRPTIHFHSPGNWMGDPNGLIYHEGYYHIFYQHNPYAAHWANMHWGHARSRDLVHWEHLPVALIPRPEAGEENCCSGCCVINSQNVPIIFYGGAELRGVEGSSDLIFWNQEDPYASFNDNTSQAEGLIIYCDPFYFEDGDRHFMVTNASRRGPNGKPDHPVVVIYEADNSELRQWQNRGVVFEYPGSREKCHHLECPNLIRLGERHILLLSNKTSICTEYFIGHFDAEALKFIPEDHGIIDGYNFYASNLLKTPDGRWIILGWNHGFCEGNTDWSGCLSLPRVLSMAQDNTLQLEPADELKLLRQSEMKFPPFISLRKTYIQELSAGRVFEVSGHIICHGVPWLELALQTAAGEETLFYSAMVDLISKNVSCGNVSFKLTDHMTEEFSFRLFVDCSVVELYLDNRIALTTCWQFPPEQDYHFKITAADAHPVLQSLLIFPLNL